MNRALFLLCAMVSVLCACGTYSLIRPADTLRAGDVEGSFGVAVNSLPELTVVSQIAYGLTDSIEISGQYEIYSALGQVRFNLMSSKKHGLALSLGVGGGYASLFSDLSSEVSVKQGCPLASFTLGRRWDSFELYIGNKVLMLVPSYYFINALKAGVRYEIQDFLVLGLEGGATFHHSALVLAEGTAIIGFQI